MSSQKIPTNSELAETIATVLNRDKYRLDHLDGTRDCAIDIAGLAKNDVLSGRVKKLSADKDVFLLDNGDGIDGRGDALLYTDNGEFRFAKLFENRDETKIPKEISDELKKLEAAVKAVEEAAAKAAEAAAAKAAEEEAAKIAAEEAAEAEKAAKAAEAAREAEAEAARKQAAEEEAAAIEAEAEAAREAAAEVAASLVEPPEPTPPASAPILEEPPPGQVQGVVIDAATEAPIQGAVVSFPDYPELNALLTSPAGGFISYIFPLGELKVLLTHPRYEPIEKTVTIEAGKMVPLGFALTAIPEAPSSVEIKEGKIELKNKIHFESGKINLHPDSAQLLDPVATLLKEHPEILKVEVGGHTDNKGNDGANERLSHRRAEAVLKYLVKQGVNEARLEAMGYGETRPIVPNNTPEGREQNRRIEFKILEPSPPAP